jgi:hypothetical protein
MNDCLCACHNLTCRCEQCCDGPENLSPPASDLDIVMRFRNLAAALQALMPEDVDPTPREKRSRVVTMMFRAAIEEMVAHVGPNAKAVTYVFTREVGKAIADHVEHAAAMKHKENVN